MQPSVASRVLVLEIQFPDRIFNTCVSANSDFLHKPLSQRLQGWAQLVVLFLFVHVLFICYEHACKIPSAEV